ncbi:hypothetical protein SprV_0401599200 [Sparganum proliferum]
MFAFRRPRTQSVLTCLKFKRSVGTGKRSKLKKEFQKELEGDPTAAENIETLSTSLLNDLPGTTREAISRAHEIQRKRVKAAIIFRKNFSPPAESSVLTWQAKEQIMYLSSRSPDEWNAETISRNFPISDPGASKFLFKSQKKPNRVFRSLESIIRHDTACISRWINIISVIVELQLEMGYIRPTLSTVLNALSHKLPRDLRWVGLHNFLDLLSFADGNACLPFPPETSLDDLTVSSVADVHSDAARPISGHSQSVLEEAISNFQFTFNSSSVTALGCLPPIATFSHQAPQAIKRRTGCEDWSKRTHIHAQDFRTETISRTLPPKQGLSSANPTLGRQDKSAKVKKRHFTCTQTTCPRSKPENAFRRHYQLVLHMRIHSEEKPFTCNRCQQRFLSSENLRRHQRHHLGVKPYTCPECQKSFFRTSERSNCLRLHRLRRNLLSSGEVTKSVNGAAPAQPAPNTFERKPPVTAEFVCPVCTIPRAYRDGGSLRKHLRSHHPDYKRPSIINLPKQPVDRRKKAVKHPSPTAVGVPGLCISSPTSKEALPKDSDAFMQSNFPSVHQAVASEVPSFPAESRHLTQAPTSWIAVQDGMLTQPVNGVFLLQEAGLVYEAAEYNMPTTDYEIGIPTSVLSDKMDPTDHPLSQPAFQQQEVHKETRMDPFAADISGSFGPREAHLSEVICSTSDDFYQQSVLMLEDSPRPLRVSGENASLCTPILPVDLCTSALCLTIDDTPHSYPIQYDQETFTTLPRSEDEAFLGESVAHLKSVDKPTLPNEPSFLHLRNNASSFATTSEEETPLDLTEMQSESVFSHQPPDDLFSFCVDEVIDLSAASTSDRSCPMDLSSQHQTPGLSNGAHDIVTAWDPEPGFSFTDLLTDEDSTTHEFLRAFPLSQELTSLTQSGGHVSALELAFTQEPKTAS